MNTSKHYLNHALIIFLFCTFTHTLYSETQTRLSVTENGLHVYAKNIKSVPLVAVSFWIRVGSVNEVDGERGFARIVQKLVLAGTEKNPSGVMKSRLDEIGARMQSFSMNDYTCFSVTGPSNQYKQLVSLVSDAVYNSKLLENDVEREKMACIRTINSENDNPNIVAQKLLSKTAYLTHPYKYSASGKKEDIISATREKLNVFYKKYYVPSNSWVIIAGDVDVDNAFNIAELATISVPKVAHPAQDIALEKSQMKKRISIKYGNVSNAHICLGWHVPGINDPDSIVLDVISKLLGGGKISKISKELVTNGEMGLAAGIAYFTSQFPSLFMVAGISTQGNVIEFIDKAVSFVYQIKDEDGIEQEELERAKMLVISETIFANETAEAQSQTYGFYAMIATIQNKAEYLEQIKKVTVTDIVRVANKYFTDTNLSIARYEPEIMSDDSKPEMLTLDNGIRLILKEDHSSPVVSIKAQYGAGSLRESEREAGISNVTANLLMNGTDDITGYKLASQFESLGCDYSVETKHSFVTFSAKSLANQFIPSFKLFIDMLASDKFDETEMKRYKAEIIAKLEKKDDDAKYKIKREVLDALFTDASVARSILGDAKTVKKIRSSDVKSHHKEYYVGSNMIVAVVGDFYIREMKEKILTILGAIKKGKVKELSALKTHKLKKGKEINIKDNSLISQIIFVSQTFSAGDERSLGMDIINKILLRRMPIKIWNALNNVTATYDSANIGLVNGGYFYSSISVPVKSVATVSILLKNEFETIRNNGFNDDEIALAKKTLTGEYPLRLFDNSSRGYTMVLDESLGLGFDYYLKYRQQVASTTKSIINKLAKEHLPASGSYLVGITEPN